MNIKEINGKKFVEVNAGFLFRVDEMDDLENESYLLNVIELIHDGAKANGWEARRLVVQTVTGRIYGWNEKQSLDNNVKD